MLLLSQGACVALPAVGEDTLLLPLLQFAPLRAPRCYCFTTSSPCWFFRCGRSTSSRISALPPVPILPSSTYTSPAGANHSLPAVVASPSAGSCSFSVDMSDGAAGRLLP